MAKEIETLDGDRIFPIYKIVFNWEQDGEPDREYPESWVLPEGRIKNSTSFTRLLEKEMTEDELDTYIKTMWDTYSSQEKILSKNPTNFTHTVRMLKEVWNCTWFGHETIDLGQSDIEALDSFERYVRRHEDYQGMYLDNPDGLPENPICLMGAEDRWRWYGTQDKVTGEQTSAPCRCEACKESGRIRISH
jgi:hypothetical protein